MQQVIGLSLAPGTRKGYHQAVRLFEEFLRIASYPQSWPIPIYHVLHYAVHMKQGGLTVGTIKGRLVALNLLANIWVTRSDEDVRGVAQRGGS